MSEPVALSIARRRSSDAFPLRLAGALDESAVEHVRYVIGRLGGDATFILLQCEAVSAVHPAAAACLWDLCRDAERRGTGRVRLSGLPARFVRRLRLHPLTRYILAEDELFGDPFGQPAASNR